MERLSLALQNTFGINEIASFVPYASYNEELDCVEYLEANTLFIANRIDDILTLLKDETGKVIGFKLKGFKNYFNTNLKDRFELEETQFLPLIKLIEAILTLDAKRINQDSFKRSAYQAVLQLSNNKRDITVYDFDARKAA